VHAVVTPDLTIVLTGDSIGIDGEVTVPLARVELAEIPEFAVAPSEDVVFVHDTAALEPGPQALAARVRIVLGDSVTFRGFNFTAEFGGGVLFVQEPEQIATASGEVVIEEGHYRAYGQDLTIENGTLRFAGGPVDDPGLAIRATRTADDGTVAGLQIGGTLQNPLVTIFSEPAMSQSRALAYIILGRAPGEGTGGGGALLSKAATSLGLRGSNALARRLGEGLGLSQATIEAEDGAGSATFVAGTYLAPDVYISYGIGLFDPATRLRIRYEISPRWAIQAERGATTGADVLFTTERGR
ncbi:MAG: translocation/assembly module TamB domain-containing protein, partial [Gemmatimonadota bacterium]|nr:translocation/assembly module TamB domain-containing protein [Gemmatimonadota bacterium]